MPVVALPTKEDLLRVAEASGFPLSEREVELILADFPQVLKSLETLDTLPDLPRVEYERDLGYYPTREENRFGAWAWKVRIRGKDSGLMTGKRVAVKDNVAVAGVPMRNGSRLLEGYVPSFDATVVTRILDAGGEILGKATCEDFCFSGGSHTSYPEPVRNPHNPEYMAGGSSSGSAVLVAAGEVDVAIGGDQGGSIRGPSSWTGVYGLKPTWGLVPYTGAVPIEPTLDHLGPIARNVEDLALTLGVIAGKDGLDPRQSAAGCPDHLPKYTEEMRKGVKGLRVGILREGFGWPYSEKDVDETVLSVAKGLRDLGVEVKEVSVPEHRAASSGELSGLWIAVFNEGAWRTLIAGEGLGSGWVGLYDRWFSEFYSMARRLRGSSLPITVKRSLIIGGYLAQRFRGHYYAKAQNLRGVLRSAYDRVLQSFHALVMPTTPSKAKKFPYSEDPEAVLKAPFGIGGNMGQFDLTGHPALSVPVGFSGGLPIGMMIVGRHFDESTLLRLAYALSLKLNL